MWTKKLEPPIDRETAFIALGFLMLMDAKLNEILELIKDEDGEEEADSA